MTAPTPRDRATQRPAANSDARKRAEEHTAEIDAPAVEVWDASVAPGGFVCSQCGWPTESEPCEHLTPPAGCCSACGGLGGGMYGMCWDCRGTGCAHPDPPCVTPPAGGHEHQWVQQIGPGVTSRHVCSECRVFPPGSAAS